MKTTSFVLGLILLFQCSIQAQKPFLDFDDSIREAYQIVLDLRFTEAQEALDNIKKNTPNNYSVYLIENHIDFMKVFINGEKSLFKKLSKNKDKRFQFIEKSDSNSPYFLYSLAEIQLQWALLHLKFGEYATAFYKMNDAYKMLHKNLKRYPDFIPTKKNLGFIHTTIGSISDTYKWALRLVSSMDGTIQQGQKEMEEVLAYYRQKEDQLFESETLVLYAFLMGNLSNNGNDQVWNILNSGSLNPKTSLLANFVLTNIAMRIGKNEEAIKLLENRPSGKEFYTVPYLDFAYGQALFRKLDSQAPTYLEAFAQQYPNADYVKTAYQKIAWYHLIHGDKTAYHDYMNKIKHRGPNHLGKDKSAYTEATKRIVHHPILLKARVLFDGGYYDKARTILENHPLSSFTKKEDQLEHIYRLARIEHASKNINAAINAYKKTIALGKKNPSYYACNAALQLGTIFEKQANYPEAKATYNNCLSMSPNQYKQSLHAKAKAGLNRIENR